MRWMQRAFAVALAVSYAATPAAAHEVGASRFDAPIPLSLLFAGAGATVAATALSLGRAEPAAERRRLVLGLPPSVAVPLRSTARLLFFLAFLGALLVGFGGERTVENFAVVFVWPVWLKGVALLSVVAGSPWRVLSPWRTVYRLLARLEGRELSLRRYPRRLGVWPALAGFVLAVGVVENLTVVPRSPRLTAGLLAAYALTMVLGGVAFGPAWFRHADAFAVLYRLLGRVSVVRATRTEGGYRVHLRPPWTGCLEPVDVAGAAAFVAAAVYTVSFDGFTDTPEYQRLLAATREGFGAGPAVSVPLYLAGLVGVVCCFYLAAAAVEALGADERSDASAAASAFAPTVLPIAAVYEVAHNYPFVLGNVGRLVGSAASAVTAAPVSVAPLRWLSLPAFWGSQVALVVAGHLVAVVAAHRVAVRRYGSARRARRAHLPLVALMVGYTVISLWIISRPVVSG